MIDRLSSIDTLDLEKLLLPCVLSRIITQNWEQDQQTTRSLHYIVLGRKKHVPYQSDSLISQHSHLREGLRNLRTGSSAQLSADVLTTPTDLSPQ